MSDMTTRSSSSQRKIRAVHDATPEYEEETEKIILLAPCFSWSDFCMQVIVNQRYPSATLDDIPADPKSDVTSWRNTSWYPRVQYMEADLSSA